MSAAAALASAVDDVLATDRSQWSAAERQEWLLAVRRQCDRLLGAEAELLAEVQESTLGEVIQPDGSRVTVACWLRDEERLHVNTAAGQVRAAVRLSCFPLVRAAVQDDRIRPGHARVLQGLVGRVEPAKLAAAEPVLLEMAEEYDPAALRGRVRIWLAEHCPELFAAEEERVVSEAGWLQIVDLGDGRHRVSGQLPSCDAETLLTALAAVSRRYGEGDTRLAKQRRADGLVELAFRCLAGGEPSRGGWLAGAGQLGPALRSGDRPAGTGWPGALHRAAGAVATALHSCDAALTPIVMADGLVLSLGRSSRLVSPAQRKGAGRPGRPVRGPRLRPAPRLLRRTPSGCTGPTADAPTWTTWSSRKLPPTEVGSRGPARLSA